MPTLLTLRPGPTLWQVDAVPHAYDEAGRVQFKAMPGVRWIPDRTAPNGRGFYRGAREAIAAVAETLEAAHVVRIRHEGATGYPAPVDCAVSEQLRSYQQDGARWLVSMLTHSNGALLADDMGIGKSAQAIAALDVLTDDFGKPHSVTQPTVLVVCPAVVVPHWRAQAARWGAPTTQWRILSYEGFRTALAGGSKPDTKGRRRIEPLPARIDAAVIDEIHYASNPRSLRAKALAAWRAGAGAAVPVIGLSGTPMTARPRDLWQPLDLLWPGRFGRAWEFQHRYCAGRWQEIPNTERTVWVADGVSRSDELQRRLRACMLRRTKADVALELPARTRITLDVEIPAKALRDLQRAAAVIDWSGDARRSGVSAILSGVEEYKVDAAESLARDVMASGGRPLILTTRKATAAELGRRLDAPVADGDVPASERQALLADAPCGVATLYSVTTGIDLVGYDCIIMTGLDWVPSTLLQGEARIHRIGQTRPVTIYYLIGQHTLDEVVRERVIERLEAFGAIVGNDGSGGMAAALGAASEEDLIAGLVAAARLAT